MIETEYDATTEKVSAVSPVPVALAHIDRTQRFMLYVLLVIGFLLFVNGVFLGVIAYLIGR
ncbi:MAG TPA: hypothetical protein VJ761_05330 [Ktedonobacteraceae bacterium]|nr:hypothetical protein [Ktedonobacteraceae bacterium]